MNSICQKRMGLVTNAARGGGLASLQQNSAETYMGLPADVVPPAPVPPPVCPGCGKPMVLIGTRPRAP